MPRSLQEILAHADELGRRFEEHEPDDVRTAAPLYAIREASPVAPPPSAELPRPSLPPATPACPGPRSPACSAPPARPPASGTPDTTPRPPDTPTPEDHFLSRPDRGSATASLRCHW